MTSNRGRETAKAAGWLVAGAIGATALTGVAYAATQDTAPSPISTAPSTSAPGTSSTPQDGTQRGDGMMRGPGGRPDGDGDGMRGRGGPGMRGGPGGGDRILHGDVTVKDENDQAVQARIQTGTIESISATSMTVKSEDGYTSTWVLNSDTKVHRDRMDAAIADLKQGDFVNVRGPLSGDTATAKNVRALSPTAKAELDKLKAERDAQRQSDSDSGSGSSTQGSNSSSSASFDTNI
jgi:hypothetical protein